jgi:lipooligosaccharide transport system permease protein
MNESLWAVHRVWLRYLDVYRKNLVYGLSTTFVEPMLYLLSFGFGLGPLIGAVTVSGHTVAYRPFVLSGLVAQTILFQAFFDAAYGGFVRMYYQKIFKAMATTPITLSEVLWGELLWDASRATFSASAVLLIGVILGDFNVSGALKTLPLCFLASLGFAGMGLLTAALAQTIESVSYPQYFFIFPMFLFCGIFYPLETLPPVVQAVANLLPLTAAASLVRSFLLGFPIRPQAILVLAAWAIPLVWYSRRRMTSRIVK